MTRTGPAAPPAAGRRWRWGLLAFAVLAGLLAMHALAPGGVGHGHPGSRTAAGHAVAQNAAVEQTAALAVNAAGTVGVHDDCAGDGGDCGGGHLHHADATCAAAAVSGAPALPALVPDPVAGRAPAAPLRPRADGAPDGARAPPTQAELQLLRI
ncbi:DUF6153 family protein [Streptomyces sp. NPDC048481]|uniref:DUF6153 family protein n=1 Tax=Streptomyces sp. NPDC048481 TaxID=3365557 RepID=UPI003715046C